MATQQAPLHHSLMEAEGAGSGCLGAKSLPSPSLACNTADTASPSQVLSWRWDAGATRVTPPALTGAFLPGGPCQSPCSFPLVFRLLCKCPIHSLCLHAPASHLCPDSDAQAWIPSFASQEDRHVINNHLKGIWPVFLQPGLQYATT